MADVVHVVNPDGSHSIGVEEQDVFVPFVTLAPESVVDAVSRAVELNKRAGQGDAEALAAGGVAPAATTGSGKASGKGAGS